MPVRLIDSLATTEAFAELFSDQSLLRAMLDFEVGLARAEARCGIIPQSAAGAIAKVASSITFDAAQIAHETLRAGTPGIPLVKALTDHVRAKQPEAAGFVHWGATSQDIADTAIVLLLKRAQPVVESDVERLKHGLRNLAEKHQNTLMPGRTLMQAAPPITFGLKAAGWLGAIERTSKNLHFAFGGILIVQFGGASGTLASLESKGIEVGRGLAEDLGLAFPDAPWQTQRDRLAFFICACGVLTGTLGKIARDISLLMQNEIGEVSESADGSRGGSSTMPHKQNPIACAVTLAAAQRVPGMVSSFLSGMVQEHERGVGGWQAEWATVAAVVQATGLALESMAEAVEGLTINEGRMRANIEATRGLIFAEKAMMLLAPKIGRDVAYKLVGAATRKSVQENTRLAEVLAAMPEVTKYLDAETLRNIEVPEEYLGVANEFRKRLLKSSTD